MPGSGPQVGPVRVPRSTVLVFALDVGKVGKGAAAAVYMGNAVNLHRPNNQ